MNKKYLPKQLSEKMKKTIADVKESIKIINQGSIIHEKEWVHLKVSRLVM